ncbi:MAG: polysaccharide pyruvyl transferase family protein [Planctomycetota bacterium]
MNPIYATWCISNNIGDALTPWLIKKITGRLPLYVEPGESFPKYMVTGSILNHSTDYTTVWGAGFAQFDDCVQGKPVAYAVRGHISQGRLAFQNGIHAPVVGDPALLLPRFYNPKPEKKCRVGFIPHYVHQKETILWLRGRDDIKLINVFDSVEDFVQDLLECEVVYSSSLHGLIIADAYGIPRHWYNGTNRLGGDGAKFADYYSLVKCENFSRPHIYELPADIEELYKRAARNEPPNVKEICDNLWSCCPFKPVENQNGTNTAVNSGTDNPGESKEAATPDG